MAKINMTEYSFKFQNKLRKILQLKLLRLFTIPQDQSFLAQPD